MTPSALLERYGTTPTVMVGVSLVLLFLLGYATLAGRRRRSRAPASSAAGAGAALAYALDGHLDEAAEILERLVREGGAGRGDAVVALVAVLRAQGKLERAANLVEAMAARGGWAWVEAVRVRVALDRGQLDYAADLVERSEVPLDLALAALSRAGRWEAALEELRRRSPRKGRDPVVEGALTAGLAGRLARGGDERAARRAAKKAVALAPDSLVVAAVGRFLHPKAAERRRLSGLVESRTRVDAKPGAVPRIEDAGGSLVEADDEVEKQRALGMLRDHLERHPTDWGARRIYGGWALREGTVEDCGSQLAELLSVLPDTADEEEGISTCGRCGCTAEEPFFVCPRCDSFGTLETRGRRSALEPARASEKGATLGGLAPEMADDPRDFAS